jgi:hypothetical protein
MAESSTVQALMILEALAQVLASAEGHMGSEYAVQHAGYVRDAARAVIRDAGVEAADLEEAEKWGSGEWVRSLLAILYPSEQLEDRYEKILNA